MKSLRNKYTLMVGVCILTALGLLGLQAVKADWVHNLFERSSILLNKAQPKLATTRVQTDVSKQESLKVAFKRTAELAAGEGTVASQPVASVLTDLNEDGRLDLVTAFGNSLVAVRGGNPDGTFGASVSFSVDGQVNAMAAGDFNGDGHMDVLVADATAQSLLMLTGDGKGSLPQAQRVTLPGTPSQLVVKDFLGDQRAELVVALSTGTQVQVLLWQDVAWLHPMSETALKASEPRTLAQAPTQLAVPLTGPVSRVEVGYVDSDSSSDIIVIGE